MTTLFNFRTIKGIKARVSNKIWKITRNGRLVTRKWGRAAMKHGRPKFAGHGHETNHAVRIRQAGQEIREEDSRSEGQGGIRQVAT